MQVIHAAAVEDLRWECGNAVLGMGTLDGVHAGHQEILRRVRDRARETGGTPAVLTFAQHPLEVVRPEQAPALITPLPLKLALLERLGQMGKSVPSPGVESLSDREIEVFQLVGRGLNSREIAGRLNLGLTTVDSYRARIKEKLEIKNAAELYQRAAQWMAERSL